MMSRVVVTPLVASPCSLCHLLPDELNEDSNIAANADTNNVLDSGELRQICKVSRHQMLTRTTLLIDLMGRDHVTFLFFNISFEMPDLVQV